MKNILYIFVIFMFSCNSKSEKKQDINKHRNEAEVLQYAEPKITGGKYFDYDKLIYYENNYDENNIGELYDNQKKTKLDALKFGVLLDKIPKSINDAEFINKLEKIGYKKSEINKSKFESIDEIFTEKKHSELIESACIYVYRDILVFKKKSKIVGIAKICFDCGDSQIFGTKANIEEFGQSGDYESLEQILKVK